MSGIIRFEHLDVVASDSRVKLVDDFNLEVHESEVVALIGESGAGKSTIGLSALGYVRAGCRFARGRIILGEDELITLSRNQVRNLRGSRVAYVAQSAATAFNPSIRIINQLVEASLTHGVMDKKDATARALQLAADMALPEPERLVTRYPHELSGGQLQRLMTVMALMCKPSLLVLDEPTTAIDVTTQLGVLSSLKRIIGKERVACLYISHDLAVVAQMADRIIVLRNGKMVEAGATAQIIRAPEALYSRELIAAASPQKLPRVQPDSDDEPPVLELHNVDASYGHGAGLALRGVSMTLGAGRCAAIIGESGSGKSTLARVITGLMPSLRGEIRFKGEPLKGRVESRPKRELQSIQLVLQHPDLALNPRVTIGDAIARPLELFRRMKGRSRDDEVTALLELVGLPAEIARRYPSQLSGGQKQRINLARALAARPDLIICDEVTSALDTIVGSQVMELLSALRQRTGVSCIFITHDISKAAAIADQIYVMNQGEVVERGAPDQLLQSPRHPYTRELLRAVPELRTNWLEDRVVEANA